MGTSAALNKSYSSHNLRVDVFDFIDMFRPIIKKPCNKSDNVNKVVITSKRAGKLKRVV